MRVKTSKNKASIKDGYRSERGVFFKNIKNKPRRACLQLEDGAKFTGHLPFASLPGIGEVVFNTGMTGYVESLTDPSYSGQILVFTYPLIGNYGVQLAHAESSKIQVRGVVVSEAASNWSHSRADHSLLQWLTAQNIPILAGVDTRALTKHLRTRGTMIGAISAEPLNISSLKLDVPAHGNFKPKIYNRQHKKRIILVDCGAKGNILKSLLGLPVQVKLVPHDYDYTRESHDGVVLSNGPGDPLDYPTTIKVAAKALTANKPIFGICLGSQIMGLAAGAKTYKLLFGHRGHNQPCMELSTNKCFVTSQNHSYALDEKTLPKDWRVMFKNLNDGSVEGLEHKTKPFFAVQFHPEACPGPTDTQWLFDRFYQTA